MNNSTDTRGGGKEKDFIKYVEWLWKINYYGMKATKKRLINNT